MTDRDFSKKTYTTLSIDEKRKICNFYYSTKKNHKASSTIRHFNLNTSIFKEDSISGLISRMANKIATHDNKKDPNKFMPRGKPKDWGLKQFNHEFESKLLKKIQ